MYYYEELCYIGGNHKLVPLLRNLGRIIFVLYNKNSMTNVNYI